LDLDCFHTGLHIHVTCTFPHARLLHGYLRIYILPPRFIQLVTARVYSCVTVVPVCVLLPRTRLIHATHGWFYCHRLVTTTHWLLRLHTTTPVAVGYGATPRLDYSTTRLQLPTVGWLLPLTHTDYAHRLRLVTFYVHVYHTLPPVCVVPAFVTVVYRLFGSRYTVYGYGWFLRLLRFTRYGYGLVYRVWLRFRLRLPRLPRCSAVLRCAVTRFATFGLRLLWLPVTVRWLLVYTRGYVYVCRRLFYGYVVTHCLTTLVYAAFTYVVCHVAFTVTVWIPVAPRWLPHTGYGYTVARFTVAVTHGYVIPHVPVTFRTFTRLRPVTRGLHCTRSPLDYAHAHGSHRYGYVYRCRTTRGCGYTHAFLRLRLPFVGSLVDLRCTRCVHIFRLPVYVRLRSSFYCGYLYVYTLLRWLVPRLRLRFTTFTLHPGYVWLRRYLRLYVGSLDYVPGLPFVYTVVYHGYTFHFAVTHYVLPVTTRLVWLRFTLVWLITYVCLRCGFTVVDLRLRWFCLRLVTTPTLRYGYTRLHFTVHYHTFYGLQLVTVGLRLRYILDSRLRLRLRWLVLHTFTGYHVHGCITTRSRLRLLRFTHVYTRLLLRFPFTVTTVTVTRSGLRWLRWLLRVTLGYRYTLHVLRLYTRLRLHGWLRSVLTRLRLPAVTLRFCCGYHVLPVTRSRYHHARCYTAFCTVWFGLRLPRTCVFFYVDFTLRLRRLLHTFVAHTVG